VKKYNYSDRCNAVWPTDTIAYRCNTCAFNPCMSLCVDCFLAANHTGHDYSRFFSLAGGACDCGVSYTKNYLSITSFLGWRCAFSCRVWNNKRFYLHF